MRMTDTVQRGDNIRNYLVTRKIGQGSSGDVFEAKSLTLRTPVILKIMQSKYFKSFNKEVAALQMFEGSSNIVKVIDHFVWRNYCVIVLEKLDFDLLDYQENASQEDLKKIFYQVCLAVKAMHDNNVAHLDIKPENIFLNGCNNVRLGDFGNTVNFEKDEAMDTTGTIGTKFYAAPEQVRNYNFIK